MGLFFYIVIFFFKRRVFLSVLNLLRFTSICHHLMILTACFTNRLTGDIVLKLSFSSLISSVHGFYTCFAALSFFFGNTPEVQLVQA